MPIRITGMNSGLDTEAIISELVSAYRLKSQKYVKAQKKLSWKQEIWKGLNTKITNFYGSITSLKYSAAYNMKSANISDSTKATVSASSNAVNGSYTLKVTQTAKTGYLTGAQLDSSLTADSALSSLGYTGGDGKVLVTSNGKTAEIDITNGMTIKDFVGALNDNGVKASFDAANHRIYVAASDTGVKKDFSLTGLDANGWDALTKLGLNTGTSAADKERYKEFAKYALNTNGTQYITGYDANGQAITDGTYDEAQTKAHITQILTDLTDASTTITNNGAQLAYANAYKTVEDVDAKFVSTQDKDTLKALLKEKDLSNVYVDGQGRLYDKLTDGTYTCREDGNNYDTSQLATAGRDLVEGATKLLDLEVTAGLATTQTADDGTVSDVPNEAAISAYKNAMKTVEVYEGNAENAQAVADVQAAYGTPGALEGLVQNLQNDIDAAKATIANYSIFDDPSYTPESVTGWITNAAKNLDGTITVPGESVGVNGEKANRVNGEDATIVLNGATYTSTSNTFTINGLTINALTPTGNDELTITVSNNVQGLYDKIKSFLKDYNALINEMTSLYNADMAKGMEPLTNEEKDALSDTDVKEWEDKIKKSLLRRDDSLDSVMNLMKSAMSQSFTINGKKYSLSSFGIKTLGVLNAKDNEESAYHIDGDSEDPAVSGNQDLLMAALSNDPDTVIEFMKKLTTELSDNIYSKMKSSSLSSFNVVYNDKQMAKEYSDYTTTIKKWEDKLAAMEDSYYKKFAAMEKALASLQGQQSSLAGLLGS